MYGSGLEGSRAIGHTLAGRWPANVIHDGSEEVEGLFPHTESGKAAKGGHVRHADKTRRAYGAFKGTRNEGEALIGDSGSAARFFYCAKASSADRGEGNDHPTVKPLALMRWLVRLVCPPDGLVLDPFCGSGTTLVAAKEEHCRYVGIDIGERYCEIARRRLGQGTLPLS